MNYFSSVIAMVMAVLMILTTSAFAFPGGNAGLPSGFVGLGVEMSDVELNAVEGEGWVEIIISVLKLMPGVGPVVIIADEIVKRAGGVENIKRISYNIFKNKINVSVLSDNKIEGDVGIKYECYNCTFEFDVF